MKTPLQASVRGFLYFCILFSVAIGPGCSKSVSDWAITNIAIADAARSLESGRNVVYLDARSAAEHAERRIPGAIHIDIRRFDASAPPAAIRSAREIIVYGQDPGSATAIALTKRLLQADHKRVYFMRDGINGWIARSLPTEP